MSIERESPLPRTAVKKCVALLIGSRANARLGYSDPVARCAPHAHGSGAPRGTVIARAVATTDLLACIAACDGSNSASGSTVNAFASTQIAEELWTGTLDTYLLSGNAPVISPAKNAWYIKPQEYTLDYTSDPSGLITTPVPGHAVARPR